MKLISEMRAFFWSGFLVKKTQITSVGNNFWGRRKIDQKTHWRVKISWFLCGWRQRSWFWMNFSKLSKNKTFIEEFYDYGESRYTLKSKKVVGFWPPKTNLFKTPFYQKKVKLIWQKKNQKKKKNKKKIVPF